MANIDERYTGSDYATHNEDWHEGRAEWKARQVADILAKNGVTPSSVCDIGCGTAGVLDELGAMLPTPPTSVVGYEVSPQAVKLVTPERRARVEVVEGAHDADDRTFDLMLCLDVFEHLEDYYGFLRDIQSKAPLAVFHVPIDTAVTSVLRPGPVLRSSQVVGHIQHFTRAGALEALRHTGYEIVDSFHTVPARDQEVATTRQRVGRTARLAVSRVNVDLAAKLMTGFPLLVLARATGHTGPGSS